MAGLISSIIGSGQQNSEDENAAALQEQALQNLQGINVPTIQEEMLNLQQEKNAGQLSPEQEGTEQIQGNALNNITENPQLVAAQMQALQSLQQQGTSGLTASDKANLQQIVNQQEQTANSQNQGTLQQFAQRGQGGSGANLAAELANNQNAANNANNQSLQIAGQAQQNALQATAAAGNLGTSIENQQYSQAANAAAAQNAINQFNTQNSQNVLNTNTQANNQAQAFNLENAQNISNTNTNIANQQQQYNSGLYQQQFNDQFQKATGEANESNNLASTDLTSGENQYENTQNIGNGASEALGGAGSIVGGSTGNTLNSLGGYAQGGQVVPQKVHPLDKHIISALLSKLSTNKPQNKFNMSTPVNQIPVRAQMVPQLPQQNFSKGGIPRPPAPGNQLSVFRMLSGGGQVVPAKVSPGEKYLTPTQVEQVEKGQVKPKDAGTKVPGKAKVKGDSPKNDTVDAQLEAGGLVIPRSIVGQKDDVIMDFIRAAKLHAKGGK